MTIPRTSPVNGSYHVEPLPKLISYNTAGNDTIGNAAATGTALTVGGIPESSNSWWQNHWGVSAATTYSGFMYELESMYNTTSLGTGGPPTHMLVDQQTYQNFIHAYFAVYKANADMIDNDYPFIGKRYLNAKLIMDDKVPDVANNKPGTQTVRLIILMLSSSRSATIRHGTGRCLKMKMVTHLPSPLMVILAWVMLVGWEM